MLITIRAEIHSGNELRRKYRNYYAYKRLRESYTREIWAVLGGGRPRLARPVKRVLRIVSYRKRLLDDDNLTSGLKPILDSLKILGVIYDDSRKWLTFHVEQFVDSKNPRTEIFFLTEEEK